MVETKSVCHTQSINLNFVNKSLFEIKPVEIQDKAEVWTFTRSQIVTKMIKTIDDKGERVSRISSQVNNTKNANNKMKPIDTIQYRHR